MSTASFAEGASGVEGGGGGGKGGVLGALFAKSWPRLLDRLRFYGDVSRLVAMGSGEASEGVFTVSVAVRWQRWAYRDTL